MKTRKKTATEHPFRDRTERFPLDALLRQHGFRILKRRKSLSAIWEKDGCLYSEHQALRLLDPNQVADAQYLEKLYEESR